ncbi:MAG: DUF3800 domain-containing protein [Coriobacteriia bacterium]
MIVAIDESGSPSAESTRWVTFVAIHLRQRRTIYRQKQRAFSEWESSLPRSLKDSKGEFKGSALDDCQLADFANLVLRPHPAIRITSVILRPTDNPRTVVDKHRSVQVEGIRRGVEIYRLRNNTGMAQLYEEFWHWVDKLSYDQFLKIVMLSRCIHSSLVHSFGHSIAGGYEEELIRLSYLIDRDFVRQERTRAFWLELLRNQVWHQSKMHPLPMLDTWDDNHPVVAAYTRNGRFDMNKLFVHSLQFARSHECFEVRIADIVASILSRNLNTGSCEKAAAMVDRCLAGDKGIAALVLDDFDRDAWSYDSSDNPWEHPEAHYLKPGAPDRRDGV